ncbi:MAG: DinB family protein [Lewinellaceae bacterium]|nr:hypothetical protein [Saprospiraceae bacterium]MCB9340226.1 DinB family protein [Lewinellaceae bacterium]
MLKPLVNNALALFEDARFYLDRVSEAAYCQPLPKLSMATVGQHTRHFLEFFQCLVEKLQPGKMAEDLVLNYDDRRRDKRIETNPRYALMVMESLAEQLPSLACDETMWLEYTDYTLGTSGLLPTSLEREILYNIEHTIHHFALIKIGLNIVSPCLELPVHFGIAPSTLHRSPVFANLHG